MKLIFRFAILLLCGAVVWTGCARQPTSSDESDKRSGQKSYERNLPFNQRQQEGGISPSSSLVPEAAEVPAGTPFTVRLKSSLSSATMHTGDAFEAVLDEAIMVQGKAIFSAGTPVSGRVMALNRSATLQAPAYLRLKLASINWQGKVIPIESSSIFAKAGVPRVPQRQADSAGGATSPVSQVARGVQFTAGRRLTFRLTAPAVLPR